MGYYVDMELGGVRIPADKVAGCLAAINALHTDEGLTANNPSGGAFGGDAESRPLRERRWYSWVNNPGPEGFTSLEAALTEWRYEVQVFEDGGIEFLHFNGQKWGSDELLYDTIAPFVEEGATIECTGEDGAKWRYVFENGTTRQETGKVVWE